MPQRILSHSTIGVSLDAPPISGGRITQATNASSTSPRTFHTSKAKPYSIPRIRILLAPYMSPFVVPLHRVETWDLLRKALQSLFGLDIFNSSIRITDHDGNSILPSVWNDLLEPDMTIIVDTCSLQAETPILLEAPITRPISPPISQTYTTRDSEDSYYDISSDPITSRGSGVGQAMPTSPEPMTSVEMLNTHNRKPSDGFFSDWAQSVDEGEKSDISFSMLAGMASKQQDSHSQISSKETEGQSIATKGTEEQESQEHKHGLDAQNKRVKPEHFRSAFSRFSRAVLYVLSAGTIQSSPKETNKSPEKRMQTPERPRRAATMESIERSSLKSHNTFVHRIFPERRKIPILRRRGISPPPSVATTATYGHPHDLAPRSAEPCRSKSLSQLKSSSFSTKVTSSSPDPSIKFRSRSKSFTFSRSSSKVSLVPPPIPPRRSSLELGTRAQYKTLSMDRETVIAMFNDLDGATLSGTRSRSGTGETMSTAFSTCPTLSFDKPLPKLPFKFSAFPAPSPPRSPLVKANPQKNVMTSMTPSEEEGFERPATATATTRKITKVSLRRVASSEVCITRRESNTCLKF